MKKLLISLLVGIIGFANLLAINGFKTPKTANNATMGIVFIFSGIDNKYEDENVIVMISQGALWVKNKTNRTIYSDLSQVFSYYNDEVYPFYKNEGKGKDVVTSNQFLTIAPQQKKFIGFIDKNIGGDYSAYEGVEDAHPLSPATEEFMSVIDDMRSDFEKGVINCSTRHFTEDESFITLKVAFSYSFDKNYSDPVSVMVSSWVSDIIIGKSYLVKPQSQKSQKEKGLSAKKENPLYLCIGADYPYADEVDENEIIGGWMGYIIKININNGTISLIDPCEDTKYGRYSVRWLGSNVDFSTILDDHSGAVRFGKQNDRNSKVVYNRPGFDL